MKRFLAYALIAAFLAACGFPQPSHAAQPAQSIQFLLSQVRQLSGPLVGGKAYFYAAGTTTPKTVWLDRSKTTPAANPYTLGSNATAQLFGAGLYRVVLKTALGITIPGGDIDNLQITSPTQVPFIDITDYGAVADDSIDDTTAIQSAVNYANSLGGGTVTAPSGVFIANSVQLKERVTVEGQGRGATVFKRNGNNPVFIANGPAYDGVTPSLLPWYQINLKDMSISSVGDFTADLVQYKGVTSSKFSNVTFSANGCTLLLIHQVWDSRFDFCEFLEGGAAGGVSAVTLKSGYGYRQTKELVFSNCRSESYVGSALVSDSEADVGGKKTELIFLDHWKFESVFCATKHINLYTASDIYFNKVYITTKLTPDTETLVNIGNGQQYYGDISVYFSVGSGLVFPKSAVRLTAANYADLDISISSVQAAAMWAVDYDSNNQQNISLHITAPYPLANGRYLNQKTLRNSTVRQLGTTTDAVAYSFEKADRPAWTIGNPANSSGTFEDFYFRNGNTGFLTFRSRGADPTASYRELIAGGHLQLGKEYNATNQLRIGNFVFWVDAQNRLRRTGFTGDSSPATDTEGFSYQTTNANTTASRPSSPEIGQQFFDTTLGKPIWWNGSAWKDAAGGAV